MAHLVLRGCYGSYCLLHDFTLLPLNMKKIFAAVLFVLLHVGSHAQCAMCKATAETASQNSSGSLAEGLNTGIIYLMLIPYTLLAVLAIVFFRKRIVNFFKAN